MSKKKYILLGFLGIITVSLSAYVFLKNRQPEQAVSTEFDNWMDFKSRTLGFTIKYPPEVSVKESFNLVQFSLVGQAQGNRQDFFDGMGMTVIRDEFKEDLDSFAKKERDEATRAGENPTPMFPSNINGVEGISYASVFRDTSVRKVFLPGRAEKSVYIIPYVYSDPHGKGYEIILKKMLSTFTLL